MMNDSEPSLVQTIRVSESAISTSATTASADEEPNRALDVSAKLAAYRGPIAAGTADDLNSSQPAASEGQARSGRSLRASNI